VTPNESYYVQQTQKGTGPQIMLIYYKKLSACIQQQQFFYVHLLVNCLRMIINVTGPPGMNTLHIET